VAAISISGLRSQILGEGRERNIGLLMQQSQAASHTLGLRHVQEPTVTTSRPMGILDKSSELVRLLAEYGPLRPGGDRPAHRHASLQRLSTRRCAECRQP